MKVSISYHEILEESLKNELQWLKEEFEILFNSKMGAPTIKDKGIANAILDYIIENTCAYDSIILYSLLIDTMEKIEKDYPNLF
ncbi:MAG: hypothetical protein JSV62_10765 [Promethearchaeota archaeon]|nr:MAG: hypothetical protein JSV62_10765 [Candidatus Lokiarchaeota archaeon]